MRPTKRLSLRELFILQSYWLGLSFMWNGLHQIILPAVLLNFVDDKQKNTYLGLLTFVGLVIATAVQPIAGAISDRWVSRWGRRRPLMLLGTAFDFVFLALLGWSGGLVWIAAGYIGLQFTSNIAHGPAQGLLPDKVPADQLGAASGVKNLMDMGGLVVAMLVLGRVLDPEARRLVPAVLFVAGILAFGLVVTLLGVHETPSTSTTSSRPPTSSPTSIPLPSPNVISYWWLIASRFLFLLGIYGIQGFAQYYIRDVMNVANPVKVTGDLLATITLALIAFAVGGGWMGDRIGHKWVLVIASGIGAVGCLLLLAARTPGTLLVYGSVLGAGIGLFLTSNWALANMLAPAEEAGKYLGLSNLATAGAGAVARLAGPLIDLLNNTWPGSFHGYTMLFTFGAVATLVSVTPLRRVHVERKTT